MISIKPSSVPGFLRESAFFTNLIDEDEEVSVPKDCCKLDTSITNAADLDELFRTLRFWGVDRIPKSSIKFLISNDRASWESVTSIYIADMPSVAQVVNVHDRERELQVCEATSMRNVDIVTCLLEHGYPFEYKPDLIQSPIRAVDVAAVNGDLDILKVPKQYNCPFHENTGRVAAHCGHYECLEFLMQNNCPIADDLVNFAFASGSTKCLKFAHETLSCSWTPNLFANLSHLLSETQSNSCDIQKEHLLLHCLEYAQAHGCPHDLNACYACAQYGLPLLLQQLHEHDWPWDNFTLSVAISNGQLECLKYAMEHGCPQAEDLIWEGMCCGFVQIVQYLHDRGVPWPVDFLQQLDFNNQDTSEMAVENVKACLFHAYKLGFPYDPDTCHYACQFGWYDLLVDAHQHGCVLTQDCLYAAGKNFHEECVQYLLENGCPRLG